MMMTVSPASHGSAVITCAEVRVENFGAWARALDDPVTDLRWSVDEVVKFFGAAWVTAAELLPQLIDADGHGLMPRSFWTGVPRMELSITAESPHHHEPGRQALLSDVLDLDPLGHSDRRDQLAGPGGNLSTGDVDCDTGSAPASGPSNG
ncbi:hypothetical protein [Amycolatopsis sp. cmx-4-61]|uniref:hypothetical protein n=1 Tax=Amycolatopsis sp. cmx-4-61 TaxID=2790937 RepID=UPI00397D1E9C